MFNGLKSRGGPVNISSKLLNAGVSFFILTTSSAGFASQLDNYASQGAATDYYRIQDSAQDSSVSDSLFSVEKDFLKVAKTAALSLLNLVHYTEAFPAPAEKYERRTHFGRWINDPDDDTCQNTRAKVLVRDSAGPVTFRNDKKCVVDTGAWEDQYTGLTLNNARQVQVDHLVPLKHAYVTGASNWDFRARCLYANFMGNKHHLIPVYAHENMSKGDSGPDRYIPPNQNITCDYLKTWMKVKIAWRLILPAEEMSAIMNLIKQNGCSTKSFTISVDELNETRRFMNENLDYCVKNRRQ